MDLTEEQKAKIDNLSIIELLGTVRFAPLGDPSMQGDTGEYILKRLSYLRGQPGGQSEYTSASKQLGW